MVIKLSNHIREARVAWLKEGLKKPGKTQVALAEHCGVSKQAIQKWLKTGQISAASMAKAAAYLEVPHQESYGAAAPGIRVYDDASELPDSEYAKIPVLDIKASAGAGAWAEDLVEEKYNLAFLQGWLKRKGYRAENLRILEVAGDSMEPRIYNGDIVLIDITTTLPKNGSVFAVVFQDWVYLKRLFVRLDGSIQITSDNPKYETETVPREQSDQLTIVGRCIWAGGDGGL